MTWLTPGDLVGIAERDPEWAVDEYVLNESRVPFVFRDNAQQYLAFLEDISSRLDVESACLTVVGSAAVGFCMSPTREYGREFRSESDIDLVVVDEALFDIAWLALRQMYGRTYDLTQEMRVEYKRHQKRYVFRGWIYPTSFAGVIPFASHWFHELELVASSATEDGHRIGARLYRTEEHAREYHIYGIRQLVERVSPSRQFGETYGG